MAKKKGTGAGKRTKRSPWPRGSRIHLKNNPLHALPDSHPAKVLLLAHAECRQTCFGREIAFRGYEEEAFDQEWQSVLLGRRFDFSAYAYICISFDLILEEWLTHPPYATKGKMIVAAMPFHHRLLDECEQAATSQGNVRILELLPQVREWLDLYLLAIQERWKTDSVELPEIPVISDPNQALCLRELG
jgi:hypothetical protein